MDGWTITDKVATLLTQAFLPHLRMRVKKIKDGYDAKKYCRINVHKLLKTLGFRASV